MNIQHRTTNPMLLISSVFIVAVTFMFSNFSMASTLQSPHDATANIQLARGGHHGHHHRDHRWRGGRGWGWGGGAYIHSRHYWTGWRPYRRGCVKRVLINRYTGHVVDVQRRCRW